jgi:3-hydroxy acid dehydrogenase/malonic semialdehyde reductase
MAREQVVLITGSSSGIGRATAYRFAKAGARVIMTYNKGKARGETARKNCVKLGAADTLLIHLDVMDDKSVRDALRTVKRKYGAVDFLINNTGTALVKAFKEHTARDIERQVRTNLEGMMKLTLAFLPIVKKGIVNIASEAGKTAYSGMAVYCGTKFGMRGFTQALAMEHPRLKIFCVNPDLTATRLTGYQGRPPEEVAETVFRAASGQVDYEPGGDVDVRKVMG